MTLKIHISEHDDDLHHTTAKRNLAGGVAGLDGSGEILKSQIGLYSKYLINDTLLHNHDVETYTSSLVYVKLKTIALNTLHSDPSTIRIYCEWKRKGNGTASILIYKNGVSIGSGDSTTFLVYVIPGIHDPHKADLSFAEGDTIEIWGKTNAAGGYCYIQNFRILGDEHEQTLAEAINQDDVGVSDPFVATNS